MSALGDLWLEVRTPASRWVYPLLRGKELDRPALGPSLSPAGTVGADPLLPTSARALPSVLCAGAPGCLPVGWAALARCLGPPVPLGPTWTLGDFLSLSASSEGPRSPALQRPSPRGLACGAVAVWVCPLHLSHLVLCGSSHLAERLWQTGRSPGCRGRVTAQPWTLEGAPQASCGPLLCLWKAGLPCSWALRGCRHGTAGGCGR